MVPEEIYDKYGYFEIHDVAEALVDGTFPEELIYESWIEGALVYEIEVSLKTRDHPEMEASWVLAGASLLKLLSHALYLLSAKKWGHMESILSWEQEI